MNLISEKILSGTEKNPHTLTLSFMDSRPTPAIRIICSTNCKINKLGYIPLLSSLTGGARSIVGLSHAIAHLASFILTYVTGLYKTYIHGYISSNPAKLYWENPNYDKKEIKIGFNNFVRGCIEFIPVIGNITMIAFDRFRMNRYENKVKELIDKNPKDFENSITAFNKGIATATKPITALDEILTGKEHQVLINTFDKSPWISQFLL